MTGSTFLCSPSLENPAQNLEIVSEHVFRKGVQMATPILATFSAIQEMIANRRTLSITRQSPAPIIKPTIQAEATKLPQIKLKNGIIYTDTDLPRWLKATTRIFTTIGSRSLLAGFAIASYPTIMSLTSWTGVEVFDRAYRITQNSTQNRTDLFWGVGIICGIITTSSLPKLTMDITALSLNQAHFYALARIVTPQTKVGIALVTGTMGVIAHLVSSQIPTV